MISDPFDELEHRPSLADCSDQVLDKAQLLLLNDAISEAGTGAMHGSDITKLWYRVTGSRGDAYRVTLAVEPDGSLRWANCTCPHGMNSTRYNRAGCSHVAAVLMYRLKQ